MFLLRVSVCWGQGKLLGGEEVSLIGNSPYMVLHQGKQVQHKVGLNVF
jgi:hypothetical protein